MNITDISKLSKLERLQTMEAIWDSLIQETAEIESPGWHREILVGRKRKIEEGKTEFIPFEELKTKYSG